MRPTLEGALVAGADPSGSFSADETRQNLRATMLLGLPGDPAKRPIFLFPRERSYAPADDAGQPWDWSQAASGDSDDPGPARTVTCGDDDGQVVCAWEAGGGRGGTQSNETPFGDFDQSRLVLTILDADFELIDGFNRVIIGGNRYRRVYEMPNIGLWDLDVHQVIVEAIDES
jgi:hypothetical protein